MTEKDAELFARIILPGLREILIEIQTLVNDTLPVLDKLEEKMDPEDAA